MELTAITVENELCAHFPHPSLTWKQLHYGNMLFPSDYYTMDQDATDGQYLFGDPYTEDVIRAVLRALLLGCVHLINLGVSVSTIHMDDIYFHHGPDGISQFSFYPSHPYVVVPGKHCFCPTGSSDGSDPSECVCLLKSHAQVLDKVVQRYMDDISKKNGTYDGWCDVSKDNVNPSTGETFNTDSFMHRLKLALGDTNQWVSLVAKLLDVDLPPNKWLQTSPVSLTGLERVELERACDLNKDTCHDNWRACMQRSLVHTRCSDLLLHHRLEALNDLFHIYTSPVRFNMRNIPSAHVVEIYRHFGGGFLHFITGMGLK